MKGLVLPAAGTRHRESRVKLVPSREEESVAHRAAAAFGTRTDAPNGVLAAALAGAVITTGSRTIGAAETAGVTVITTASDTAVEIVDLSHVRTFTAARRPPHEP